MDVREKLVELANDVLRYLPWGEIQKDTAEQIADRMMDHGVTVQEWISVNDRLPTEEAKAFESEWDETPEYLVMIDRGYLPTTLYYDWENNEWFKINTALKRERYKVTHWMEKPQPPKGE